MTKEEMRALAIKVTKEAIKNTNYPEEIKVLKNRLYQAEKKKVR